MRIAALAVLSVVLAPVVYFAISFAGIDRNRLARRGQPRLIPRSLLRLGISRHFLTGLISLA